LARLLVVLEDRAGAELPLVAESRSGPCNGLLRAEAINARGGRCDQREDRVALRWGLRKKTIQILVRLSLPGAIDYSVRWLGYGCQPSTLSRQHPPLSAVLVIRGR
jgi:hypothetical protein